MDFWSIDKLSLFILFVMPGFISIKVYSLIIPQRRSLHYTELLDALFYSSINYALLSWFIYLIFANNWFVYCRVWFFLSVIIILVLFPTLLPIIFIRLRRAKFLKKYLLYPVSKPWDYVFGKGEEYWLIVYLTNGTKIGGKYSGKSYSSSFPEEEQIYIEEVWRLSENDDFVEPFENSKGMIILNREISYIQLFEYMQR